jgi:hypothetical protein
MPQRASNQLVSTNVGKMIFHGQSAKRIEHALGSVDKQKMHDALSRRGLGGKDHKEIAKVLSGEHRSGWRHSDLKNLVEVLQDVDLAKRAKSAGEMVLKASRDAQLEANPGLTAGAIKARLKRIAREQREEVDAPVEAHEMSVLDRMRGAAGRANKVEREASSETRENEPANKSVRKMREEIRQDMKLQPKFVVPKKSGEGSGAGFQA